jgi:hypothetical protein
LHKCIHVSLKKSVKVKRVDVAVEGAKMAVVFGCSGSETFLGPGNTVRYDYVIHAISVANSWQMFSAKSTNSAAHSILA